MKVHPTSGTDRGQVVVANWAALRPHDPITLQYESGLEQDGVIDEVAEQGDTVWINYSNLKLRKLIHKSEAVRIWCDSSEYETPRITALLHAVSDIGG